MADAYKRDKRQRELARQRKKADKLERRRLRRQGKEPELDSDALPAENDAAGDDVGEDPERPTEDQVPPAEEDKPSEEA